MPTRIVSTSDGPRITVNDMIKSPTLIPRRILSMMDQRFLSDVILRKGSPANSGVVEYYESTPLYADDDAEIVAEYGEIPLLGSSDGTPKVARVTKRGGGVAISREMRDRNNVDRVNMQTTQVRNTMVKAWDGVALQALLTNANTGSIAASSAWSNGATSKVRFDLGEAIRTITLAVDDQGSKLGFRPDTLVISDTTAADFLESDDLAKVYQGNIADQNIQYVGKLPNKIFGLNVLVTGADDLAGKALVLERGTVGFISDERPLQATPLYEIKPRETWRSDVTRASVVGVDQPKAACIITGV